MTTSAPRHLREQLQTGAIPRFALEDWQRRFGVVAGVTGRGDNPGEDFDLGFQTPAPTRQALDNWSRFRKDQAGFHGTASGSQVHGSRIEWHETVEGWIRLDGVDGHATSTAGILLTVTVADCVPIFLVDPVRRAIALLHSGWKGTAAGILRQGIELLEARAGSIRANIVMHCGVAICGDCYEVGGEVLEAVGLRGDGQGPWQLDLRGLLLDQAMRLGVAEITTSEWCTAHHRNRFFSHRGSGGTDGRMVAYVGYRAAQLTEA